MLCDFAPHSDTHVRCTRCQGLFPHGGHAPDRVRRTCPGEGQARKSPSLLTRAANGGKALLRNAANGFRRAPADVRAQRKKVCESNVCGKFGKGWCELCGCHLQTKQAMAAESCPDNPSRWPAWTPERKPGPVRVATQVTRSQETGPAGVTGPLVYGGALPLPSLNALGTDLQGLLSALDRYPADLLSALAALVAQIPRMSMRGAIVVVDLPLPLPLPESTFLPLLNGFHWSGHTVADIALRDYKRLWIPLGTSTGVFKQAGAAGVVFVFDASYEALEGNDSPFLGPFEPLPAL